MTVNQLLALKPDDKVIWRSLQKTYRVIKTGYRDVSFTSKNSYTWSVMVTDGQTNLFLYAHSIDRV